jgi:DUF438 domain-containing protein
MRNISKSLIKEHERIEQFLLELEIIMEEEAINYPNLIHTLKQLIKLWDSHEKREEQFFEELKDYNYKIPYKKMLFEHGKLRKNFYKIKKALKSGSEFKMKQAMIKEGLETISLIRQHKSSEDEILYRLPEDFNK